MVNYQCETCDKTFKQKVHYDTHKAKKRPCMAPVQEVDTIVVTKPFLKWVGGKTQIIQDVLALFPTEMQNYHEPFVGGGSVLLGLLSHVKLGKIKISGNIYASDVNEHLIALYKNIQALPNEVIAEVRKLTDEFSMCTDGTVNRKANTLTEALTSQESYYFWIRTTFNTLPIEERRTPRASAMVLFMNKTCFRGLYREGPHGFNVPFGNYTNPTILDETHIYTVSELIKDVVFTKSSYIDTLTRVVAEDFVYLDPPYAPEQSTSFVGYTADGFGVENHHSLFKLCNDMHINQVKFVMSNADVTLVRDAFPPTTYNTKIISCRRSINSRNPQSVTNEVLITN